MFHAWEQLDSFLPSCWDVKGERMVLVLFSVVSDVAVKIVPEGVALANNFAFFG